MSHRDVCDESPTELEYDPAAQASHVPDIVAPTVPEKDPALHPMQADNDEEPVRPL